MGPGEILWLVLSVVCLGWIAWFVCEFMRRVFRLLELVKEFIVEIDARVIKLERKAKDDQDQENPDSSG